MKTPKKLSALCLLVFTTAPVNALTLDYYVYGGFHIVVDAFTRMAFFFNNREFEGLIFVITIMGILTTALIVYSKAVFNAGSFNPVAWMWPIFIGAVIYIALIVPKGNLFIYDPVLNKTQRVSGIPTIIVIIAGVTNKIERVITEIVTESSAHPYKDEAGGITFQLVFNTLTEGGLNDDHYLDKTLRSYISGCVTPMLRSTGKIWDMKEHEADQHRFLSTFRNQALFAVIFKPDDTQGTPYTCTEVWDEYLSKAIKNVTFTDAIKSICRQSGFGSKPAEVQRCKTLLERGASNVFNLKAHGGDLSSDSILRNKMIADAIHNALTRHNVDEGVRQLTNKAVLLDGIGTGIAANSWTNNIKAVVAVAIFSIILFLLCFIITPWIWKILMICFGLCFFIASWGAIDAIIHQATIDGAMSALSEIQRDGLSVRNLWMSSPEVLKTIALMGKSRSMSILIAISVSGMLTGISGYAFAQIGSTWQADLDRKGEEAANEAINPEQRGARIEGMARGQAQEYHANEMGWQRYSETVTWREGEGLHNAAAFHEPFREEGYTLSDGLRHAASVNAGTRHGHIDGINEGASGQRTSPGDYARNAESAATNLRTNEALGKQDAKETNTPDSSSRIETMRNDAYRHALEQSTRNTTLADLQNTIGSKMGKELTDGEFYTNLNKYFQSDTIAKMDVTTGDPDKWIEFMKNSKQMSMGEFDAIAQVAKENGSSMVEVGRSIGTIQALDAFGKKDAIDSGSFNQEDFQRYVAFQTRLQAEKGGFMTKLSENYEGGTNGYLKDMAEHQEADHYGRMAAFTTLANRFYEEEGDAAVAIHGSNISVAVKGLDIDRFEDVLEPHQLRHLSASNGGVVNFSMGEDGKFLTAHTITGKSALENNSNVRNSATVDDQSTRKDFSYTRDSSTNIRKGTDLKVGNQTSPESAAQMSIDPQHRETLETMLRDIDDNRIELNGAETKFVKDNGAFLKDIVNMTNTDVEAIRHNLNAGIGFKAGVGLDSGHNIAGFVGRLFTGGSLNAAANIHGGYEHNRQAADTDAKQANLNFTPVAKLYNLTRRMAENEIRQDISENHQELDMNQRQQKIDEKLYDLWAEKFQGGMQTLLADAIARNQEQFDNTGKDKEDLENIIKNQKK